MDRWLTWHDAYDTDTHLRERLLAVQARIRDVLSRVGDREMRVISMCAGDGRDLLDVLADMPGARVSGRLVELHPDLAARARARSPAGLDVVSADAGLTTAYAGAVPADLVLACGVFGNLTDGDIERTVRTLPTLAAPHATVIWTRHRRPPDRTIAIRRWFEETGFREIVFDAPQRSEWSVGVHQLTRQPAPFLPGTRMFSFVDD